MSKFKNIGIAEAGVVPDLSRVFGNMVRGFQNISLQQQQQEQKMFKFFAAKKAKSNKLAAMVESKANNVMSATDDVGLDEIITNQAIFINKPIQETAFVSEKDARETVQRLDMLDVMKNDLYKTKQSLIDFKKTASFENMSDDAMEKFTKILDNDFFISDVTERSIHVGDETITMEQLKNMYVARDDKLIRNAQILLTQHVDSKKASFSSIRFNQDFNALFQGRSHAGALLMVEELEGGPKGSIKDQLLNNVSGFISALNSLNSDLDKDGTKDSEQITVENAEEFIDILTKPGNENYDEETTNVFAKTILETQSKTIYETNVAAAKANQPGFDINVDLFDKPGGTGRFIKNLSGIHRSLHLQDPDEADRVASLIGLTVLNVDGKPNTYQLYKFKLEDDGDGGSQKTPTEPVSNEFNVTRPNEFISQFELMLSRSKGQSFNPKDLNTYMQYISDANRREQLLYPDVETNKQTGGVNKKTGGVNIRFAKKDPLRGGMFSERRGIENQMR